MVEGGVVQDEASGGAIGGLWPGRGLLVALAAVGPPLRRAHRVEGRGPPRRAAEEGHKAAVQLPVPTARPCPNPPSSSRSGSSDLAKRGLAAILGWQWDKRYPRLLEISPDSTSLTSGGRFFICILFTVVILSLAKLRFEGSNQRFPPTAFFTAELNGHRCTPIIDPKVWIISIDHH